MALCRKTQILAVYSQEGHHEFPEDTWSDKKVVETAKELYSAAVLWYKRSASTFNGYPFNGLFNFSAIYFIKRDYVEDTSTGERFYSEQDEPCASPGYFEEAATMFQEYVDYISRRLPELREARRLSEQLAHEKKELERLRAKFKSE